MPAFAGMTTIKRLGSYEVVVYPTILFYRVLREQVEVVRVVDGRRDIAAIFGED